MKKLMIAAAIVCAAALSQAASGNWGTPYTVYANQDINDQNTYNYTWWLVETATADNSGISVDSTGLVGAEAFDDGVHQVGRGGKQSDTITGATAGKYYSLVILNQELDMWGISTAVLATADPTDQSGNTLLDMTFINAKDPWGRGKDVMMASEAVPEPTSGLLLLLGVAGLALRRRRA